MNRFTALIDPTDFGTIANYLRQPGTGIDYIVHARNKALLPELAEWWERAGQRGGLTVGLIPRNLNYLARAAQILISARHHSPLFDPQDLVTSTDIPRTALCHVLYLPPLYLAHTPGLFEGTLIRPQLSPKITTLRKRTPGVRCKL